MNPADQFGHDVASGIANSAPGVAGSAIIELLMKLMGQGGGQTPPPSTTSQQTMPPPMVASPEMMQGIPGAQPMPRSALKNQMMGR